MKVRMTKILGFGDSENERILIDVLEDCELGNYVLALSNIVNDISISNKIENVYWLENQELKKGDLVIVYTKRPGTAIQKFENQSGAMSYFLFWNLDTTISSKQDKKVVCLETTWSTMTIEDTAITEQKEGNGQQQ